MVLVLSERDVRNILEMHDCIAALEECLVDQSKGKSLSPMRTTIDLGYGRSRYNPKQTGFLRMMPGSLGNPGLIGVKIYVDVNPTWTDRTVFHLYESLTGRFLAMISADYLSDMRTGAIGGVAVKYLSRNDSRILGIFGAGRQARTQLESVLNVRSIERVKVISRSPEHTKAFVDEMTQRFEVDFEICKSPLEVIRGTDIVITATTANQPLFSGNEIDRGTHVNAIGASFPTAREVDEKLVSRSRIVVNNRRQALHENGEFKIPAQKGQRIKIHGELCDIVSGKVAGRTTNNEITLFKFNGLAIWDIAAGALVYKKAREMGLGKDCEL